MRLHQVDGSSLGCGCGTVPCFHQFETLCQRAATVVITICQNGGEKNVGTIKKMCRGNLTWILFMKVRKRADDWGRSGRFKNVLPLFPSVSRAPCLVYVVYHVLRVLETQPNTCFCHFYFKGGKIMTTCMMHRVGKYFQLSCNLIWPTFVAVQQSFFSYLKRTLCARNTFWVTLNIITQQHLFYQLACALTCSLCCSCSIFNPTKTTLLLNHCPASFFFCCIIQSLSQTCPPGSDGGVWGEDIYLLSKETDTGIRLRDGCSLTNLTSRKKPRSRMISN